jgi:hypothetical protein
VTCHGPARRRGRTDEAETAAVQHPKAGVVGRLGAATKIACTVDPATPPDATAGLTEQNGSRDRCRVMDPPDDGAGTRRLTKQNGSRDRCRVMDPPDDGAGTRR